MTVAWFVIALALFAIWITGHWFGAALSLATVTFLCLSGGAIWPNALGLFVLAAAPYIVRRVIERYRRKPAPLPGSPERRWAISLGAILPPRFRG